jgi:cytochrome c-type biogenesis protein CcmF
MLMPADPFRSTVGPIPLDGTGPNPLLQNNALVAFHPPLLYIGYVGCTVPFAFAVGMLVTGRVGEDWLLETRRWTLLAWGALAGGLFLGAWWSYQVLGWGGFWAWDPVENAAFVPWLCATAYLHSVAVQERRAMLKVWNLSLLVATFSLTVLGTFLTRSGVLESVHSFTESNIGPIILGFFGLVVAVGVGLIGWRGDELRAIGRIDSALSREGAFLLNNFLLGLFAFVVLLGTVFPLFVQAINGSTVAVGAPYFDRMGLPIVVCLLFLMAVGAVLPWRRSSAAQLRSRLVWPAWLAGLTLLGCVLGGLRGWGPLAVFSLAAFAAGSALRQLLLNVRRLGLLGLTGRSSGGMVVHIGVAVVAVAFAGAVGFGQRGELRLAVGQQARFDGRSITYLGSRNLSYPNRSVVEGLIRVDGKRIVAPQISQFSDVSQGVGTPAVISGPHEDLYLTLDVGPAQVGAPAVVGVVVQPLVVWLWIGGGTIVAGTALAALPERRRLRRRRASVGSRSGASSEFAPPVAAPADRDDLVPSMAGDGRGPTLVQDDEELAGTGRS